MIALCHNCFKSGTSCTLDANSGYTICTPCLKKIISKPVEIKCNCVDCEFHHPEIRKISNELDPDIKENVEG